MSEEIKEIRDGSFLCVNEKGKAYWGVPEGYPYKDCVTIEWDGNTEGLDAVGGMFYRVSNVILSDEQIKAGFIKNNADIELPIAPMWDELVGTGMITDDISIIGMVAFVRKDNVSFNGVVFGTAGVYFANKNNHYATKFTNEIIHPIAAEFLPTAASVSYLHSTPTAADYNALLASLNAASYIGAIYPPWTQSNITSVTSQQQLMQTIFGQLAATTKVSTILRMAKPGHRATSRANTLMHSLMQTAFGWLAAAATKVSTIPSMAKLGHRVTSRVVTSILQLTRTVSGWPAAAATKASTIPSNQCAV